MSAGQLVFDCEPDWTNDDDEPNPAILHDLRGQGLTETQLHTMTDVPIQGDLL